ncbi:MAG: sensor histidine kinase [Desulfatiglandales bacterium]
MKLQDHKNGSEIIPVLLVEDDEDDYIIIRDQLEEITTNRYDLVWVTDYDDALRAMESRAHAVCLLDFLLDTYEGFDLLREAKSRAIPIPIIFLTGQPRYEVDMAAMMEGAADYLVKDEITPSILERSIRYAIEKTRTMDALAQARDRLEQRVEERTRELREVNEALRISSEKIKRFAYSVSHDLKSPVLAIHGLTRRLKDHYGDYLNDRGKHYCEQILLASEQLARLVEMINLYISTTEVPAALEDLGLRDVCNAVRDEFSPKMVLQGVSWESPEGNPRITADPLAVLRCLRNLVDNALKYGGEAMSKITVRYHETDTHHILSVADDGAGLNTMDKDRIFNMFVREKSSSRIDGAGLGLAIVKEIAEQHGGDVWAEPEDTRGFTVYLSISKTLSSQSLTGPCAVVTQR